MPHDKSCGSTITRVPVVKSLLKQRPDGGLVMEEPLEFGRTKRLPNPTTFKFISPVELESAQSEEARVCELIDPDTRWRKGN